MVIATNLDMIFHELRAYEPAWESNIFFTNLSFSSLISRSLSTASLIAHTSA